MSMADQNFKIQNLCPSGIFSNFEKMVELCIKAVISYHNHSNTSIFRAGRTLQSSISKMLRSPSWHNYVDIRASKWKEYWQIVAGAKEQRARKQLSLQCGLIKTWATEDILFLSFHVLICMKFLKKTKQTW